MLKEYPYVKIFFLIGFIEIAAVIAICLMPIEPMELVEVEGLDKLQHFFTYLFLSLYFCQLLVRRLYLRSVFLLIVLGIIIECLQSFTDYRMFDLWDIVANTLGVLAGYYWGVRHSNILQQLCFKFSRSPMP